MVARALLLVLLLAPLRARAEWKPPTWAEAVPLVLAAGLISVDVVQTKAFLAQGTPETNPLMGAHPSNARLFLEGGVLPVVALTVAWYFLPPGWRILPCAGVIGAETQVVLSNAGVVIRF